MLLAKTKFTTIEALIVSYINHDEFVSVNNVLREYNEMKEEIKNSKNAVEYTTGKQWQPIVSIIRKILRKKIQMSEKLKKIG